MNTVRRARDYEIVRNGKTIYTNRQFLAARLWLEDLFKKGNFRAIDSSYPGCSENTVIKMKLEDYFKEQYKPRKRRR